MYYKGLLFVMLALAQPWQMSAQKVKLISATEQSWSGGIPGHSGSNCTFVVVFTGYKNEPTPDTIWVGNRPLPLSLDGNGASEQNMKRMAGKKQIRFEISARIKNKPPQFHPGEHGDALPVADKPPVKYKGVALLSYNYNGKRCYYTIGKYTKIFPPVSYP